LALAARAAAGLLFINLLLIPLFHQPKQRSAAYAKITFLSHCLHILKQTLNGLIKKKLAIAPFVGYTIKVVELQTTVRHLSLAHEQPRQALDIASTCLAVYGRPFRLQGGTPGT
jgi:hypothetical protein